MKMANRHCPYSKVKADIWVIRSHSVEEFGRNCMSNRTGFQSWRNRAPLRQIFHDECASAARFQDQKTRRELLLPARTSLTDLWFESFFLRQEQARLAQLLLVRLCHNQGKVLLHLSELRRLDGHALPGLQNAICLFRNMAPKRSGIRGGTANATKWTSAEPA